MDGNVDRKVLFFYNHLRRRKKENQQANYLRYFNGGNMTIRDRP